MNSIGQSIRAARLAALLKQSELAEKIGVDHSRISKYETDSRTPSLLTAVSLADELGVSLDELVGRTPPKGVE